MKGCFIHRKQYEIRMKEVKISENAFCYIQPSITVMRFFGMIPVTCEFNNGNYTLKISKTKIIFWYVVAITLGGLAIFGVFWDSKKYRQEGKSLRIQKDIDVYINTFDISIIILSVVSVIFSSPFRMKYFMNALHCINKIDTIVREPISNAKKGGILLTAGLIFGHGVSLFGSIFDGQYHIRKSGSGSWILYLQCYGTMFFFYSAIFAQQMAYWSLVSCINKRITVMNQVITRLARKEESYIERYFGNNKVRIQIESGTQNTFENHHLNKQNQYSTIKSNDVTKDIIELMMSLHEQIYMCVHFVNRFFDFPVLFILINCLVELVINPWALLTVKKFAKGEKWVFIMWIVIHTVQLLLLIEPINGVLTEQKTTRLLIVQLLKANTDIEISEKIKNFGIQCELCSLEFSSVDMIVLSRSLYTAVTSAVTTYLVILIQINK